MNPNRIVVNSPTGSGNVFCQNLLLRNLDLELKWINHNILGFEKYANNLFILRNPYDVIASGIEIRFEDGSEDYESGFMDDIDFRIKDKMILHVANYQRFINMAQHYDYITTVSFEFLTKQPDKFLNFVSDKFDIPFAEKRHTAEDVIWQIANNKEIATRVPREKTELRKKIDLAVHNYEPLKHTYEEYILFRDTIQSTENML